MINNNICLTCEHEYVCKKMETLVKFDEENKKYIGVDIKIEACRDYCSTARGE